MSTATPHAAQAPLDPSVATANAGSFAMPSHEAARYAVIRRMGSAIRHQIAGALQPVSMLSSLLERRTQAASPNLEALRKNAAEMSSLSRSASSECVALMGWIAPPEGELVAVAAGVDDCLHLLATELSFRGFAVVSATHDDPHLVSRVALRTLLPAMLMALTDNATQAGQVAVSVEPAHNSVKVALRLTPGEDDEPPQRANAYRALTWPDVQALADNEGVTMRFSALDAELVLAMQAAEPMDGGAARWS